MSKKTLPVVDEFVINEDGTVTAWACAINDLGVAQVKLLPELATNLNQLRESSEASRSEVLVTIYANEQAKYERVVDVLDALSVSRIA